MYTLAVIGFAGIVWAFCTVAGVAPIIGFLIACGICAGIGLAKETL